MAELKQNSEIKLISSVIESIKPSFSNSDIDQETLAKLEQLWIKKLKLLDDRDQEDQDKLEMRAADEEGQTSALVGSSCSTISETDEDLESIVVAETGDGADKEAITASAADGISEKDGDGENSYKVWFHHI